MNNKPIVYIVDDDTDMLRSLHCLITAVNLPVETYSSAESFLESYRPANPGCMLLDIRMPGMGGLKLLEHLQRQGAIIPVIVLTGHGDVPMVVQANHLGAFAFLEKPFNPQQILDSIRNALNADRYQRAKMAEREGFEKLLSTLSKREREVLDCLADGLSNRAIAEELGISERTLEKHRKQIFDKLQAHTWVELLRSMLLYQLDREWPGRAGQDAVPSTRRYCSSSK